MAKAWRKAWRLVFSAELIPPFELSRGAFARQSHERHLQYENMSEEWIAYYADKLSLAFQHRLALGALRGRLSSSAKLHA